MSGIPYRFSIGSILVPVVATIGLALALSAPETHRPAFAQPSGRTVPDPEVEGSVLAAAASGVISGSLALQRSENPQVRTFARDLLEDQTLIVKTTLEMARQAGTPPVQSGVAAELAGDAQAMVDRVALEVGAEFDRAYVREETAYLKNFIETLDDSLMPKASSPGVKRLLTSVRSTLTSNLGQARDLGTALGG